VVFHFHRPGEMIGRLVEDGLKFIDRKKMDLEFLLFQSRTISPGIVIKVFIDNTPVHECVEVAKVGVDGLVAGAFGYGDLAGFVYCLFVAGHVFLDNIPVGDCDRFDLF
jgi:hypothetical protein